MLWVRQRQQARDMNMCRLRFALLEARAVTNESVTHVAVDGEGEVIVSEGCKLGTLVRGKSEG